MGVEGDYLGMPLRLNDLDHENLEFFRYCAAGEFRLQSCGACGLMRYPPTTACPFCAHGESSWEAVEGQGAVQGAVHSYTEVHHAIQPAFKAHLPYQVLLVDLDTQLGQPTEHDALRVTGNLVAADGALAPAELVARVGIGSRMKLVFTAVADGLALPQWSLDEDAEQPAAPWRYPQE